jgi:glutathione synthase/RimK-type ligase-like ATP-grasp enzyme
MKLRIVPYKLGSKSAKMLADDLTATLGYKVWAGNPKPRQMNLLWGADVQIPNTPQSRESISIARNKLYTFNKLKEAGVSIPDFTTSKVTAQTWINERHTVFARQSLTASGGYGIVISNTTNPLPEAPLYVKYMKKKKEFRVHVFNGQAIDVQEKRRRSGDDSTDMIRNLDNGWVFCREDIVEPTELRALGVKATQALGLLFGAVDIIYNERYNTLYVLEVNTAPGLSPTTSKKYANSILSMFPREEIMPTPILVRPRARTRVREVITPLRRRRRY